MPAVIQGVLVCGRRGWGWPGRSRTGIGCSSPLAPVGAGLCPSPASRVDGGFKRICRGRPVCRPVNGSRAEVCPGGHIGPPLRGTGAFRSNGNRCETEPFPSGAGRSPPPTGGPGVARRRGEVTPPYGCNTGGAKQRADVPRAWLPPTKFRAEIWGVSHGHRPLRPAGDEGRAAGSSAPTGRRESCRNHPGQRRSAEYLRQRV